MPHRRFHLGRRAASITLILSTLGLLTLVLLAAQPPTATAQSSVVVELTGTCPAGTTQPVYVATITNNGTAAVDIRFGLSRNNDQSVLTGQSGQAVIAPSQAHTHTFNPVTQSHTRVVVRVRDSASNAVLATDDHPNACTSTGQVTATLSGTCPSGAPVYTLQVTNTTSAAVTVQFRLNFDSRPVTDGIQEGQLAVPAGGTPQSHTFQPVNLSTHAHQNARIDWVSGTVIGPAPLANPCPAQVGQVTATLSGTCPSGAPVYTLQMTNTTSAQVVVRFRLNFDALPATSGIQENELTLAATTGTGSHTFQPVNLSTNPHQNAKIDWVSGTVTGPAPLANPCPAQVGQVMATLGGTCTAGAPVYTLQVTNTTSAQVVVRFKLNFDALPATSGIQEGQLTVPAGGTPQSHAFQPVNLTTNPHQNAKIDWVEGTVQGPAVFANPCPAEVEGEITASMDGICQSGAAVYTLHVTNGTDAEVTVRFKLNFDEQGADAGIQESELEVPADQSEDHVFQPVNLTDNAHLVAKIDWIDSDVTGPEPAANPCDSDGTVEATLAGECVSGSPVYTLVVANGTDEAVTLEFGLNFDDKTVEERIQQSTVTVDSLGGQTHEFAPVDLAANPHENAKIDWVSGTVTGPGQVTNPCTATPVSASSNTGLAVTGVAIVALGGLAALLFANGGGLLRMIRRPDWGDEDR